ncbi:MAG: aminoacyl-tRNA deacylase [Oscillospiraceae bacterium]|nr:aminoacyl-tRNA deacylase [Oscillospiraceae bacterium]
MEKPVKTNAVRILEQLGVRFRTLTYTVPEGVTFSGDVVSGLLGLDPDMTFKTLCTRGKSGAINVFCIPVNAELDLRKAAKAAGEKNVELVHVKELRDLTGYERGAVSPLGLKKSYPIVIDETATLFDEISVSGGAKGLSLLLPTLSLAEAVGAVFADVT